MFIRKARFIEIREVNGTFARLVDPAVISAMVGLAVPVATDEEIRTLSPPKEWLKDPSAEQRIVRQPALVNALRQNGKEQEADMLARVQSSFFLLAPEECIVRW